MPPTGADGGPTPGRSPRGGNETAASDWTAIEEPAAPPAGPAPAAAQAVHGPVRTAREMPSGPLLIGPMNFADVLDGAFTLYRENFRTLVTIGAVIILPVQLLTAWLSRDLFADGGSFSLNSPASRGLSFTESSLAGVIVLLASSVLVVPFLCGVVCRVASVSYFGGRLGPADAIRAVRGRWWSLTAAWILVHIAEGIGGVLAFFPALLVMALFVAVAPAIAIEGLGPIQAMRRSARLLQPRLFPVLGVALGSALVVTAVDLALGWFPELLGAVTGEWGWLFSAAGTVVTSVVTTPYVALVATLVYLDARIRTEGMDVALLARGLAHRDTEDVDADQ